MKVAILGGTGSFGHALAHRLAALGEDEIVIGSRDAARAHEAAEAIGGSHGPVRLFAIVQHGCKISA